MTRLMHRSNVRPRLLNHLVSATEQSGCYREAKCLRRFEIDDQIDLGCLLDRHVGRLFTLENSASVRAGLPPGLRKVRSIAHQGTVRLPPIDCGYGMTGRLRCNIIAVG